MSWGVAVGGVASALGGVAGGLLTNAANSARTQRQMDFQERMSRNRYQYTMEDMKKAGLNPILAYKQGGGSAPSGAAIPAINPAANLGKDIASAMQLSRLGAETDALQAKAKADNAAAKLTSNTTPWLTEKSRNEAGTAREVRWQSKYKTERHRDYGESMFGSNLQSLERMLERAGNSNSAKDAMSQFNKMMQFFQ